jgi:hypothetical protein
MRVSAPDIMCRSRASAHTEDRRFLSILLFSDGSELGTSQTRTGRSGDRRAFQCNEITMPAGLQLLLYLLGEGLRVASCQGSTEPEWPTEGLRLTELLIEISNRENMLPVWNVIASSPVWDSIM